MNHDRNLLFGILAVQMGKVTPSQLLEAAGAWATDPSQDLSSRLLAAKVLSPKDCALLDAFVAEAVKAHDGDSARTLSAFGGHQQVQASFHGVTAITHSGGVARTSTDFSNRYLDPVSIPGVDEAPGRYTQVSEYGRGGMGRVLLVHDAYLSRNIALKELLPGMGDPSEPSTPARQYMNILSRFLQEARITGQLEHPSIVPVYELGHRSDGALYYTMKLVRGRTLRQALAEAGSLEGRLRLLPHFVDLCNAIAYSHSQNVIHRDIKPANVMVGEFGETVVLDWGLAKLKGETDVHADEMAETLLQWQAGAADLDIQTVHGQIMGTPAYMSPEQAKGNIDQIDNRTDVYALGVVLYELLTGQLPFQGKTAKEIINQVMNGQPRDIVQLERNVPLELAAIARRAMQKDPAMRYQSTKEMAEDVQRFLSGALVGVYDYSLAEHLRRFAGRHHSALSIAAIATVILLGLSIYSYINIVKARNDAVESATDAITARQTAEQARITEVEARKQAEAAARKLESADYSSSIQLAQKHIEAHERDLARERLMHTPQHLRNWEWGYLYNALDTSRLTIASPAAEVLVASFSPDGSRIVTGSSDGTAKVWDANNGDLLTSMESLGEITSASYSPDGSRIVTADGECKVWDATTGAKLTTFSETDNPIRSATFSPDGARIVAASANNTAKIWDAATGAELLTLSGHTNAITSASYSPDGARIVTTSVDRTAKIWDAAAGTELQTLSGHWHSVIDATFSPNGQNVVTASQDRRVKVWDAASGLEIITFFGHRFGTTSASYSPDGAFIVTASSDKTAKVWDADTGKELITLSGHADAITSASFSPDGSRIVTTSDDRTAKIWDRSSGSELLTILRLEPGLKVPRFDLRGGTESLTLAALGAEISCASFSPDGSRIVTASLDNTATVWDAATGVELLTFAGHEDALCSASYSPDGTRIVTTPIDTSAKVWDAATGAEILTLTEHDDVITRASYSPDGTRIVTALSGGSVVYDASTGEGLLGIDNHGAAINGASFSPDGLRIVTASNDKTAKVWDAVTGVELVSLSGHGDGVPSASYSPDGSRIVTGSLDNTAKVWDAATGVELMTFSGHGDGVLSASFSPDGSRIVTGSLDHTAKVWDAATGLEMVTLTGHGDVLFSVSFSPDGSRIVTASFDRTAKIWSAAPWKPDAWTDDGMRNKLISLVQREAPEIIENDSPMPFPKVKAALDDIELFAKALRGVAELNEPQAFRNVAEHGIYVEDISLLPTINAFPFENHDMIIGLNARWVHSVFKGAIKHERIYIYRPKTRFLSARDVAATILDRLQVSRQSVSDGTAITLDIEVVNLYHRRIHRLSIPGSAHREVHFGRQRMLEALTHLGAVAERDMKAAQDRGEGKIDDRPLYITELAPSFQLEPADRLVLLIGREIRGYSSLIDTLKHMREQIETGALTTSELVVYRENTNQYVQMAIIIDP